MKHVQDYYTYITEGKTQHHYTLKTKKDFNVFDMLNAAKEVGGDVLDNKPGKRKDEVQITIAFDDKAKAKVEEVISKFGEIL